jgi:hypothetical protein
MTKIAHRHAIMMRLTHAVYPRGSVTHAVSHADFDAVRRTLRASDGT